jgi:hypothetical protein
VIWTSEPDSIIDHTSNTVATMELAIHGSRRLINWQQVLYVEPVSEDVSQRGSSRIVFVGGHIEVVNIPYEAFRAVLYNLVGGAR